MIVPTHKMLAFDVLHVKLHHTTCMVTHTQTCTHGHVAQNIENVGNFIHTITHTHVFTYTRTVTNTQLLVLSSRSLIVEDPLTPGQSYSITCELTGVNGFHYAFYLPMEDRWYSSQHRNKTLSFSPLRLTDAGRYTCQVSLFGMVFSGAKDIRIPS